MEFIDQILATVKSSPNPEIYYLSFAVALIVIFYTVYKMIKFAIMVLLVCVLILGYNVMQGRDINEILASVASTIQKEIAGEGDIAKIYTDFMAKAKNSKTSTFDQNKE